MRIQTTPAPPDRSPRLLDISLTIDVNSAAPGLPPFAGYASRWFQLDSHPPFMFSFIPGVGPVVVPGLAPGFVNDAPVRVLIYQSRTGWRTCSGTPTAGTRRPTGAHDA